MKTLANQKVIVTGGGSGLGFEIARTFESAGASVWVCDVDAKSIDELNESDSTIQGIVADAGSENDVQNFFKTVLGETAGKLDILVNNAGIAGPNGPLESLELQPWLDTLRVNIISAFLCSREAITA